MINLKMHQICYHVLIIDNFHTFNDTLLPNILNVNWGQSWQNSLSPSIKNKQDIDNMNLYYYLYNDIIITIKKQ